MLEMIREQLWNSLFGQKELAALTVVRDLSW